MKISKKNRMSDIAGIGTIIIVFAISYWQITSYDTYYSEQPSIFYLGFITYTSCFILNTRSRRLFSETTAYILLAVQLIAAFMIMANYPIDYLPILTIIWASLLPFFFSLRNAVLITLMVVIVWFGLYQFLWNQQMIFSGLLYGTFHFFAILMTYHARQAEEATETAQQLNKELQTAQQLLTEASKQNERTRIARDLHDLLGHHLTALLINLQVAGHLSQGDAKTKIDECHSLAKLLMSDVRESVSSLRENSDLDFESLVKLLIENLPRLKVHAAIDTRIPLDNLDLAKTLLSCIQEASTNSLKHSNATEFWITLQQHENILTLEIYDNGQIKQNYIEGHGIKGMRERVLELNGEFTVLIKNKRLHLLIEIPLQKNANQDADDVD